MNKSTRDRRDVKSIRPPEERFDRNMLIRLDRFASNRKKATLLKWAICGKVDPCRTDEDVLTAGVSP